jgi:cation:H+ antiporter
MLLNIIFVVAGFMLLVKGADYLVEGSSSIARRFGVSTLVIGLTVVAFGTSAPELAVNILSASFGKTELAFGNINGSNIANILLILGLTAFIARVPITSRTLIKEIPFMVLSGFMLMLLSLDIFLEGADVAIISRIDGLVLVSFFFIFMYYLWLSIRGARAAKKEKENKSFALSVITTISGFLGLVIGGYLAVEGASNLAVFMGVSETLVGLTIVAIGTSLPELVTALVAAKKGETDLAVGNVVGSNIFNILLVLGTTATIHPIPVTQSGVIDATIAFSVMLLTLVIIFLAGNNKSGRDERWTINGRVGSTFLVLYILYIIYVIVRG